MLTPPLTTGAAQGARLIAIAVNEWTGTAAAADSITRGYGRCGRALAITHCQAAAEWPPAFPHQRQAGLLDTQTSLSCTRLSPYKRSISGGQ